MPFLIFFGLILVAISLIQRYANGLKWEPEEDACNMKNELYEVKTNKISYYCTLYGGILLSIIGLIGTLIF